MTDKWVARFIRQAQHTSNWSKDPRRKVGCVIVDNDYNILSGGFNGFPRGISDDLRLQDKEVKNRLIVHAEANAIAAAARNGHSVKNATAFISNFPCRPCAGLLIQAGIKKVYCIWDMTFNPTVETQIELKEAKAMLLEAKVKFTEIKKEYLDKYDSR